MHAQPISTDLKSEAKEHKVARPKPTTASAKIDNIHWQFAALLRKAVFDTVPGTANIRRGVAAQTPSMTSSE